MSGALYLVSTPIGNMEDLTFRGLRILKGVSFIAAEHPDYTQQLLRYYRVQTPLTSYHNLNKEEKTPILLERLRQGQDMALVVDEGTPLVEDPGYYLVKHALASGVQVIPVPGPSSVLTALVASGLPCDRFSFHGSLSKHSKVFQQTLTTIAKGSHTSVLFCSIQDILSVIPKLRTVLGNRQGAVGVDLTGPKETFFRGRISQVLTMLAASQLQGPITLVIAGRKGRNVRSTRYGRAKTKKTKAP